ncbi:MAG: hypothetical protein ACOY93_20285 [Bacillota bacterium]
MPLVANAVLVGLSLILGIRLIRQYVTRPRPHSLWYAVGLLLTAVAALPELYYELTDQVPTLLWWVYWASGSSLVGFLAVGTAYLISPALGRWTLYTAVLLTLWVTVATVLFAGTEPGPEMFRAAPNWQVKMPFLIQNIGGSLVILLGAAISYIKTRGLNAVLIALGTFVFAAGGGASGLMKYGQIFAFTQTAGILLLYAGVSLSLQPGRKGAVGAGGTRAVP